MARGQQDPPSYPAHTRETRERDKTAARRYTVDQALEEAGDRVALRAGRMSAKELKERQDERAQALADDAAAEGVTRPAAKKTAAKKTAQSPAGDGSGDDDSGDQS